MKYYVMTVSGDTLSEPKNNLFFNHHFMPAVQSKPEQEEISIKSILIISGIFLFIFAGVFLTFTGKKEIQKEVPKELSRVEQLSLLKAKNLEYISLLIEKKIDLQKEASSIREVWHKYDKEHSSANEQIIKIDREISLEIFKMLPFEPLNQEKTVNFIAFWEGFHETPYEDAGGWSYGYGFQAPHKDAKISRLSADGILWRDIVKKDEKIVEKYGNLPKNQRLALISLAYNTPQTNPVLKKEDFYNAIISNDREIIEKAFYRWTLKGSIYENGLTKRRSMEIKEFFGEEYELKN